MQLSLDTNVLLGLVWLHFKHVNEIPARQYVYEYKLREVPNTSGLLRDPQLRNQACTTYCVKQFLRGDIYGLRCT